MAVKDTERARAASAPPGDPWRGAPEGAHEWVSFPDPAEERTWLFDVSFMESRWTCIFGRGCQGVLTGPAPELVQGCCSYGAHFTDAKDVRRVEAAAATLTAEQWQFRDKAWRKGARKPDVVVRAKSGEITTRLVKDACIFLNRPDHPGGAGCALHRAAIERGVPHLELKPDVCWQLPLRRDDEVAEDGHVTSIIRQWDRRDWGDGGFEFHWWCTEDPEAFVGERPVYEELRDELVALVGKKIYRRLVQYLEARSAALGSRPAGASPPTGAASPPPARAAANGKASAELPVPAARATAVRLPHPAVRRSGR
ncbi:MAG TPA: hypothetical protein VLZ77_03950 [Acidimicrobiales bacterium]|nr:hypothetical protein [Acidimicrobiales bacterium]